MKLKHGANQANEHVLLTKHTNPNNEIMTGTVTDTKHCYLKLVECFEIPKGKEQRRCKSLQSSERTTFAFKIVFGLYLKNKATSVLQTDKRW